MMAQDTIDLTDAQTAEMTETFEEYETEYREDDGNSTVVYEDDDLVIIADHSGYEVNEWADEFGADRGALLRMFRAIADEKMDADEAHKRFSYSDAVVFRK